jgi:cathepsin L
LNEHEYQEVFTNWMQKYQKTYSHDEFHQRYSTWKGNFNAISHHNTMADQKGFTLEMNQFGDLTDDEFRSYYLGTPVVVPAHPLSPSSGLLGKSDLEDSVDWREKGAVTPVKDQGQCGSCWSFSATGSIEGCNYRATGSLVSLSEQNLVDCSTPQGNNGCNGGLMTSAMDYIIKNGGIDTEASYPYTAQSGVCKYSSEKSVTSLKGYHNVEQGSEEDLKAKVAQGPTSIAIDASKSSLRFYSKGVYFEPGCSSERLDHGVLAVGYGSEDGQDYWIVKNSWGTEWGNKGYVLMSRNRDNNCGVATMATFPNC